MYLVMSDQQFPAINQVFCCLWQVDEEVVREMVNMGFDICEVIGSVLNHLQNEVLKLYQLQSEFSIWLVVWHAVKFQITVTYYLLLHRQFQGRFSYGRSELRESSVSWFFPQSHLHQRRGREKSNLIEKKVFCYVDENHFLMIFQWKVW